VPRTSHLERQKKQPLPAPEEKQNHNHIDHDHRAGVTISSTLDRAEREGEWPRNKVTARLQWGALHAGSPQQRFLKKDADSTTAQTGVQRSMRLEHIMSHRVRMISGMCKAWHKGTARVLGRAHVRSAGSRSIVFVNAVVTQPPKPKHWITDQWDGQLSNPESSNPIIAASCPCRCEKGPGRSGRSCQTASLAPRAPSRKCIFNHLRSASPLARPMCSQPMVTHGKGSRRPPP
jgi:hypothetical protein